MNQPLFFKKQFLGLLFFLTLYVYNFIHFIVNSKIIFSYILIILSMTFLPYLKDKLHYSHGLQKILFIIPLYLPFLLYIRDKKFSYTLFFNITNISFFLLGIVFVCLLLLFNISEIKAQLNSYTVNVHYSLKMAFKSYFELIIIIIGEEFYFRFFLLDQLTSSFSQVLALIITSMIFSYTHYLNRWSNRNYNAKSYISLFLLSVILGSVFIFGGSFLTCIFLHIIYNVTEFIIIYKRTLNENKNDLFFDDYN